MALNWLILCTLVAAGISGCFCTSQILKDFSNGNREFSAAAYQIVSNEQEGNFLISPISTTLVMALAGLGANGETFEEISRGLKLPNNKRAFIKTFSEVTPHLRGTDFYALSSANRLFVRHDFKVNKTYQVAAENVFDAGVTNVDFEQSATAASAINQWVEQKTNNKIHDLITPDDLSASTRLLLVNALYFKSKWMKQFDKYDTTMLPFYPLNGNEVRIDMMQAIESFNYFENTELDCKFLEMYYEGGQVSMVFVLPNQKYGLKQLETRMSDVLKPQPLTKERVRVVIPLFSMETTVHFKPVLEKLNIRRVFTTEADLSGIGALPSNLYIDKVIQKTFINVTEKGTEAASATAAVLLDRAGDNNQVFTILPFVADHPFLFILSHTDSGVLFVGRYSNPNVFE